MAITSNSFGRVRNLLQSDVGNGVLDQDLAGCQSGILLGIGCSLATFSLGSFPLIPGVSLLGVFGFCQLIAPVAERALGEFHDVAFVHKGNALASVGDGILDR